MLCGRVAGAGAPKLFVLALRTEQVALGTEQVERGRLFTPASGRALPFGWAE